MTLVLDAHGNAISSGTVYDDFRGFVATIDDPNQYPMTTKSSVMLKSGQYNTVAISATNIHAGTSLKIAGTSHA